MADDKLPLIARVLDRIPPGAGAVIFSAGPPLTIGALTAVSMLAAQATGIMGIGGPFWVGGLGTGLALGSVSDFDPPKPRVAWATALVACAGLSVLANALYAPPVPPASACESVPSHVQSLPAVPAPRFSHPFPKG